MSWAEYGGRPTTRRSPLYLVAATAVVLIGVLAFVLVRIGDDATSQVRSTDHRSAAPTSGGTTGAGASPGTTATTVAGVPAQDGAVSSSDDSDRAFTVAELQALYPQDRSGLDAATYQRATSVIAAFTSAQVTNVGRERFPASWPTGADPAGPLATGYSLDFVTAMAVPDQPGLVRTLTAWHGTSRAGVPIRQARTAVYLRQQGNELVPVATDDLPIDVARRDALLSGISVLG